MLRRSSLMLLGTVAGLVAVYLGPGLALVAGVVTGDGWLAGAGAAATLLMAATYLPMIRYYGLGWAWAFALPAAASLYCLMTVDSARRHWLGRGVEWKGRRYQPAGPGPGPASAPASGAAVGGRSDLGE